MIFILVVTLTMWSGELVTLSSGLYHEVKPILELATDRALQLVASWAVLPKEHNRVSLQEGVRSPLMAYKASSGTWSQLECQLRIPRWNSALLAPHWKRKEKCVICNM